MTNTTNTQTTNFNFVASLRDCNNSFIEDSISLKSITNHDLLKSILDGSISHLINDSTSREMIACYAATSIFFSPLAVCKPEWEKFEKINEVIYLLLKMLCERKPFDRKMTNDKMIINTFEMFLCKKDSQKWKKCRKESCFE